MDHNEYKSFQTYLRYHCRWDLYMLHLYPTNLRSSKKLLPKFYCRQWLYHLAKEKEHRRYFLFSNICKKSIPFTNHSSVMKFAQSVCQECEHQKHVWNANKKDTRKTSFLLFNVDFEKVSQIFLVFLLLTLNKYKLPAGEQKTLENLKTW